MIVARMLIFAVANQNAILDFLTLYRGPQLARSDQVSLSASDPI